MFDVDGTLVRSLDTEDQLFPKACELGLGLDYVSNDWSTYKVPSDTGIVTELVERHYSRTPTDGDFEAVEKHFHNLLAESFQENPENCPAVPGGLAMFERVQQLPNTKLAIATAGWGSTARLKLKTAGYDIGEIPLASANDGYSKRDIMQGALQMSLQHYKQQNFDSFTYIGDSFEDSQASKSLNCHHIQIHSKHTTQREPICFSDYRNLGNFLATVQELKESTS